MGAAPTPPGVTPQTPISPRVNGFKQDVYTLGEEGQVILQWPEKISQGSYDELVDWLELQMRKIARVNALTPRKTSGQQ